jgi:hypothetical protein
MKVQVIAGLVLLTLLLAACGEPKDNESAGLPELVEQMTMPSGFDNDYVINLKKGKSVKYTKPVLRIINFDVTDSFKKAIDQPDFRMDEQLKSVIAESGRYILLGTEDDIDAAIKEQEKLGNDFFDDDSDLEMGYLRVAGYTLTGKITENFPDVKQVGGYFELNVSVSASITVTDAETGEITFTKNIKSENVEQLFVSAEGVIIQGPRNLTDKPLNAINSTGTDIDLGPQYRSALDESITGIIFALEQQYPVMGEVVGVDGDEVISTASSDVGIKNGDYLFIVRIGSVMQDSSGRVLGFKKKLVGASQVIVTEKNMSTARVVTLKDPENQPQQGDIVISLPASAK